MQDMAVRLSGYLSKLSLPSLGVTDILEIALISFFIYQFMVWIKFTRAYTLLKGILIVLLFILFAYVLKMNTILWIIKNLLYFLPVLLLFSSQNFGKCWSSWDRRSLWLLFSLWMPAKRYRKGLQIKQSMSL